VTLPRNTVWMTILLLTSSKSFVKDLVQICYGPIREDEDSIHVVGCLCLLRGEYVVIINSKTTARDTIETLATALKHFDLDQIYLRPAVRKIFDRISDQRPPSVAPNGSRGIG